ncbi:MAG: hypothetical protein A2V67_18735 [Deltaproteobacteria bacterium RBG_13_61_14]|nr:MAG: hypothetical protein A2V67_18735 [Deltaproteobacteria bacterium RBG_13_61_14]
MVVREPTLAEARMGYKEDEQLFERKPLFLWDRLKPSALCFLSKVRCLMSDAFSPSLRPQALLISVLVPGLGGIGEKSGQFGILHYN